MKIIGEIVEIGILEGVCDDGVVIKIGDRFVTVAGMSKDEVKACAPHLFSSVTLTIEATE